MFVVLYFRHMKPAHFAAVFAAMIALSVSAAIGISLAPGFVSASTLLVPITGTSVVTAPVNTPPTVPTSTQPTYARVDCYKNYTSPTVVSGFGLYCMCPIGSHVTGFYGRGCTKGDTNSACAGIALLSPVNGQDGVTFMPQAGAVLNAGVYCQKN